MYKSLFSTIKDLDQKGRIVVAANAFGNVDAQGDVSMAGSFDKTISENFNRLKWFLNHDREKLVAVPIQATPTKDHLEVVGQLNMDKEIGRDTYADYKLYAEYGKTLEHSIGVDAIKFIDDNGLRKVTQWKWWELSTLTSWGANERTPMLDMKSFSPLSDIDWLEIRMKKGNYTDATFIQIQKAITELKSLCMNPQNERHIQPITSDALADVTKNFINTLN